MDDEQVTTKTDAMSTDLRRRIYSGSLAPGAPLPSEAELGERYSVSRTTVRRALEDLIAEGLLRSRKGAGYWVRDDKLVVFPMSVEGRTDRRAATQDVWRTVCEREGLNGGQRLEVAVDIPPRHVAQALNVPIGDEVVIRRRIRTVDDEPWMISTAYYRLDIARGTPLAEPFDLQPGPLALLRELGREAVRDRHQIGSRPPSPAEARLLNIEPGVSMTTWTITSWDREEVPVRCTVNLLPGDRLVLESIIEEPLISTVAPQEA